MEGHIQLYSGLSAQRSLPVGSGDHKPTSAMCQTKALSTVHQPLESIFTLN